MPPRRIAVVSLFRLMPLDCGCVFSDCWGVNDDVARQDRLSSTSQTPSRALRSAKALHDPRGRVGAARGRQGARHDAVHLSGAAAAARAPRNGERVARRRRSRASGRAAFGGAARAAAELHGAPLVVSLATAAAFVRVARRLRPSRPPHPLPRRAAVRRRRAALPHHPTPPPHTAASPRASPPPASVRHIALRLCVTSSRFVASQGGPLWAPARPARPRSA